MSDPIYTYLRDMDVPEGDIEQRIGEGWTLKQILIDQVEKGLIELNTGYCCCGLSVDAHTMGDGHSPVDEGWYIYSQLIQD